MASWGQRTISRRGDPAHAGVRDVSHSSTAPWPLKRRIGSPAAMRCSMRSRTRGYCVPRPAQDVLLGVPAQPGTGILPVAVPEFGPSHGTSGRASDDPPHHHAAWMVGPDHQVGAVGGTGIEQSGQSAGPVAVDDPAVGVGLQERTDTGVRVVEIAVGPVLLPEVGVEFEMADTEDRGGLPGQCRLSRPGHADDVDSTNAQSSTSRASSRVTRSAMVTGPGGVFCAARIAARAVRRPVASD